MDILDIALGTIIAGGIAAKKLAGLKKRLTLDERLAQQSLFGVARALVGSEYAFGDPGAAEASNDRLRELTVADLQRVAAKYLAPNSQGVLKYVPAALPAAVPAGTEAP